MLYEEKQRRFMIDGQEQMIIATYFLGYDFLDKECITL